MSSHHSKASLQDTRWRSQTIFLIVGFFISSTIAALLVTSFFLSSRVKEYTESRNVDDTWSSSQVEVAYLRFQRDLIEALKNTAADDLVSGSDARQIVNSFDVLFARIDTLADRFSPSEAKPHLREHFEEIQTLRNELSEDIDTKHPYTPPTVQALLDKTDLHRSMVREFILANLSDKVAQRGVARQQLNSSLSKFLLAATVLLLFACVIAISMMYLWRENNAQTQEQERISSYLFNVLEASHDAIIVLNDTLHIREFNSAAEVMFGSERSAAKGVSIIKNFTPPHWRDTFKDRLTRILNDPTDTNAAFANTRVWAQRANGDPFPAELTVVRELGVEGEPILIGFLRDISDEVEARARTHDALAQAQSDAAAKSRFLATMSHEMRTPLHGMIASLDMIDINAQDEETKNYINMAREASNAALEQTEDVLDIAKKDTTFDAGSPSKYNPQSVISSILSQLDALSKNHGNTIEFVWDGPTNNFGLRRSFSRSIYNLVSNAIKFTQDGTIKVIGRNEIVDGVLTTYVEVSDTGIGIKPADTSKIFNDFYSNTSNTEGVISSTGLGLGIAQRNANALGGAIDYSSTLGQGSLFWVSFPSHGRSDQLTDMSLANTGDAIQSIPWPEATAQTDQHLTEGKTVLVIEDHSANRHLIARMAERLGFAVETAVDGLDGVQKAFDAQFDLILTDVSMPHLDGPNTAACLRTFSRSQNACIIAVTAHAELDVDDGIKLFDHGIDGIIAKPFTQQQLKIKLLEILEEHADMMLHTRKTRTTNIFNLDDFLNLCLPKSDADALIERANIDVKHVQDLLRHSLQSPASADYPRLASAAHHAAGGLYFLGASGLGDTLIEIEKMAKDRNNMRLKGLHLLLTNGFAELETTLQAVSPGSHCNEIS
jgi:PAS domain S-box-containing protein